MKKGTVQLTISLIAVATALGVSLGTAGAAEKLAVEDSLGNKKFSVHDDGSVGIGTGTPSALLDISPADPVTTDAFKVQATDTYNSFQFKIFGHTGGNAHTQMVTDLADSRLTVMAAEAIDYAPRLAMSGPQDVAAGVRGWLLFDYGSGIYDLPNAQFNLRHYGPGGKDDYVYMIRAIGRQTVAFPTGNVGIGTSSPTHLLQLSGGAYSDGTTWVNASSRELKENIQEVSAEEALKAVENLQPVSFNYKKGNQEQHVGFIAEDVPELVATSDRKGLDSMDITAVLTKVIQEQQKTLKQLQEKVGELEMALQFKKDKDATLAQADVVQGLEK